MPIAMIFISLALLFYTTAIWSERLKHNLMTWMVMAFITGFILDVIGTIIMAMHMDSLSLHSGCGIVAMFMMGLHLLWAILALLNHGKCELYFHRFSIYAWGIWMCALITGMPIQKILAL
ncbi:MAG: HsmA family protein [bacterium]